MHHAGAICDGIRSIDQLGFFGRKLASVKQKEEGRESGNQDKHAIYERLPPLPMQSYEERPARMKADGFHTGNVS